MQIRTRSTLLSLGLSLFLLFILLFPSVSSAQIANFLGPIVPQCGGEYNECDICDGVKLIQNVLNFLIAAGVLVATAVFAYGGFLMVTNGGSQTKIDQAKELFMDVFWGFLIMLSAWLIVDTGMKTFLKNNGTIDIGTKSLPWNQVLCPADFVPADRQAPRADPNIVVTPSGTACGNSASCVDLKTIQGISTTNGSLVVKSLAEKLATLQSRFGIFTVTEACPNSRTHKNACHAACTCVDVRRVSDVKKFITEANNTGLFAVYETTDPKEHQTLLDSGISARNLWLDKCETGTLTVGSRTKCWISGPHFSVYGP